MQYSASEDAATLLKEEVSEVECNYEADSDSDVSWSDGESESRSSLPPRNAQDGEQQQRSKLACNHPVGRSSETRKDPGKGLSLSVDAGLGEYSSPTMTEVLRSRSKQQRSEVSEQTYRSFSRRARQTIMSLVER